MKISQQIRCLENQIRTIDQRYLPTHIRLIGVAVGGFHGRTRFRRWLNLWKFKIGLRLVMGSGNGVHVVGRTKW